MGGAGKVGHPIGPGEAVGRLEEVERGAWESREKASLEFGDTEEGDLEL